jgi:hypothetical protein
LDLRYGVDEEDEAIRGNFGGVCLHRHDFAFHQNG